MTMVNNEKNDCKKIVCIIKNNLYISEISNTVSPLFFDNKVLDLSYKDKLICFNNLAKNLHLICENDIYSPSLNLLKKFYNDLFMEQNGLCFLGAIFVLYESNIVGFLNFKITYEDCEIEYICIKDDFKRKGIASLILFYLENFCSKIINVKINKILLEVGEQNISAINLYKKFKFNKVSERKKYYKNGENALILEKKI